MTKRWREQRPLQSQGDKTIASPQAMSAPERPRSCEYDRHGHLPPIPRRPLPFRVLFDQITLERFAVPTSLRRCNSQRCQLGRSVDGSCDLSLRPGSPFDRRISVPCEDRKHKRLALAWLWLASGWGVSRMARRRDSRLVRTVWGTRTEGRRGPRGSAGG